MDDDTQTRAEAEAQVAEGSAGEFALVWLHTVLKLQRWDLAMESGSPGFRGRSANRWLDAAIAAGRLRRADREDAFAGLVAVATTHPLWETFAVGCVSDHRDHLGDSKEHLALGGRPRPVAVDLEAFLVVDFRVVPGVDDHGVKLLESPMDPLWRLVVRHLDGGFVMEASHPAWRL